MTNDIFYYVFAGCFVVNCMLTITICELESRKYSKKAEELSSWYNEEVNKIRKMYQEEEQIWIEEYRNSLKKQKNNSK